MYEVCAAEVEGAAAAVTDEEKAVYEMPVESNALKNWPEGPGNLCGVGNHHGYEQWSNSLCKEY